MFERTGSPARAIKRRPPIRVLPRIEFVERRTLMCQLGHDGLAADPYAGISMPWLTSPEPRVPLAGPDAGTGLAPAQEESFASPASTAPVPAALTAAAAVVAPAASSTNVSWSTAATSGAKLARVEGSRAVVNGKLYVFGGYVTGGLTVTTQTHVYNPSTKQWSKLKDAPVKQTHGATAVDGNNVYIAGLILGDGDDGPESKTVLKYNVSSNSWSTLPSLPAARGAGALARVGRELHFVGGLKPNRSADAGDHYVLNLDAVGSGWKAAPSLPGPRNHLGGVELNGKLYVIGGQHLLRETTDNQSRVDVYDPKTKKWSRAASLPFGRGHINASSFSYNGRIYVIGGESNGGTHLSTVSEYDPDSNAWRTLKSLPSQRKSPIAHVIAGKIYVYGGQAGKSSPIASQVYVGTLTGGGASPPSVDPAALSAGTWSTGPSLPLSLGEIAGGIVGSRMYIVGQGPTNTLAFDFTTNKWLSTTQLAKRPAVGDHHAAEVINGKLYLIGGLYESGRTVTNPSGRLQIYNPATNAWSYGKNLPYLGGSVSSAVINGQVYIAGGVVNTSSSNLGGTGSTTQAARYNPSTNTWTSIRSMPKGVNHAAAATDGKKFYVFGGRTGPNAVANGVNTVQVYDPATNSWTSSDSSSSVKPLPIGRGGMGKAVYYKGEFFIFGGETASSPGAMSKRVYNRVDIYNPSTKTWRQGKTIPVAVHGIYPMLRGSQILIPGGGTQAGYSQSKHFQKYSPGT